MKPSLIFLILACATVAHADDLTIDGKTYKDLEFQKLQAEGPSFKLKGTPVFIPWAKLTPELVFKYRCEGAIQSARNEKRVIKLSEAFSLSQIEEAKKKAIAEGKPLGFLMVWGSFFDVPCDATKGGSADALLHFQPCHRLLRSPLYHLIHLLTVLRRLIPAQLLSTHANILRIITCSNSSCCITSSPLVHEIIVMGVRCTASTNCCL